MNWRLDRVVLQGFKSFRDRTLLDFPHEVTGIIGPNGSGKSNLVEAIRFATGARFREIRGGEGALLFQGEGRPGFLEVRLEFSRGRERLVLERRLQGEKALLRLNGRSATWRQVGLALAGTGLVRGYAVVGQGEVGRVLEAEPEALLLALEEAAGLRPVAEALRTAEDRLREAEVLLAQREERVQSLRERLGLLREEAERVREARRLQTRLLQVRRGLYQARRRELEEELLQGKKRLQELEEEARRLLEEERALGGEKEGLLEEKRLLEEEVRALQGEAQALLALKREEEQLKALLLRLERPEVPDPGPPPPSPPLALEEVEKRRRALREEEKALRALLSKAEAQLLAYEKEQVRYEAALEAHRRALAEREAAREALARKEEELKAQEAVFQKRQALRERLSALEGELKALEREKDRLERLLSEGTDLSEGVRRVRGLGGVIGVVVDLLEVPPGHEVAVEAALGPRLQWVLTRDEEAAKAAIARLKREGGRATFLPLTLLKPPRLGPQVRAPGVLGPLYRLVRLRGLDGAEEAVLYALFGETWLFEGLEAAIAYYKAAQNPPRLVTLEGEVLERLGALTGGRVKGGGERLRLRARLRALLQEEAALREGIREVGEALKALPEVRPSALRAEVEALRQSLSRPLPPPPSPPQPPRFSDPRPRLQALEEEKERLETLFAQALAYERHQEAMRRRQEYLSLQAEAKRVRARLEEIARGLEALLPLRARLEEKEARLRALGGRLKALAEAETRLLLRRNQLASERENLRVALARKEAALEGVLAEFSLLPEGEAAEGSSRQLAQEVSRLEAALARMGPVNPLAEREEEELTRLLEVEEKELQETRLAASRLRTEAARTKEEYEEALRESFHRFQGAFAHYAQALLGAEGFVERGPRGLELRLRPRGKRVQDLRLFSLGEKTLGALAFLFALGEVQGGLPIAILDEVDAALDEANLIRFASFLKGRQFILVTHQKRTMEACQALYGVTNEGGVSRVYAIRKEETA
ncbi:AAA family ATPase [Thermus filiformis]|uniref:SMC hinge domain-containing protein n=1 Tax=Thermus filiformis TaxID=276 RepID=A0A0D6X9G7_THEFI|nr:chromosome segregation SMC family protein [Thermus filiformis]KIX84539.1 hypothetical protein THFILI_07450 [Thermus filiformis]